MRAVLLVVAVAVAAAALLPARAEIVDEASLQLAPAERARLQTILDEPIPPGALNLTRNEIYRRKDLAAFRLGDNVARERVLREWAAIEDTGRWNLRILLAATDKRDEAYRIGEEMLQARRSPINAVRLRMSLAMDHLQDGQVPQAKKLIDEAEAIVRRDFPAIVLRGDSEFWKVRAEIELHQAKASMARRQGRWAEGIEQARLAVDKGKRLHKLMNLPITDSDRTYALASLIRMGVELARQQQGAGQYAEAEWTLRDLYRTSREWGFDDKYLHILYQQVGDYYAAIGRPADALGYVVRAEKILADTGLGRGSARWHSTQMSQVTALCVAGRWSEAWARLQDVDAAMTVPGKGPRRITAQEQLLGAYVQLRLRRHEAALSPLLAGVEQRSAFVGPDHYFTAVQRGLWASALAGTGQTAEARTQFARALRGLTAPESLTGDFAEDALQRQVRRFILEAYVELLAGSAGRDAEDAEKVFEVAEQLTASSVQQALSEAAVRAGVGTPGLAEIIRKEQDARNEHAALSAYISGQSGEDTRRQTPQVAGQMRVRMRELEALRRTLKAQIQKDFPDYFQLVQPRPPSPREIAARLGPEELFLAVVPLGDAVFAWAIDAQGQVRFHRAAVGESELRMLVDLVRRTLDIGGFENGRVPAFAFAEAHRIYQAVFAPFDEQIAGKRHLVVSTAGALAQLPFAVLPRKPHAGGLQQAPWLLRDVAVSHVPSASGWLALKRFAQVPKAPQALAAWGDPVFDLGAKAARAAAAASPGADAAIRNAIENDTYVVYSRIPPLPETRDEVQALARILGADAAQDLVLGDKATRQSVLEASKAGTLAKKRVVVFATHGLLAGDLPDLNQPALAMAANADVTATPLLTLEDVLGLKLNADWVVLSACNTAGADGRALEAMSGLARGFFYAGSRSLLVTHWSVESQSAMLLTTNTFDAYTRDAGLTRAEALRQAMLKVMAQADYAHPAFWAPYALVGEGGR